MAQNEDTVTPEGFLRWMEDSNVMRGYNDLYYRFIVAFEEKLSIGATDLPQNNYRSLQNGWQFDQFTSLHRYISTLLADRTGEKLTLLFGEDPELSGRARQEFRTAIDQYSRFVRGVSPKLRQKAAFFRQHFFDNYVTPAREAGRSGFVINTGDVIRALHVIHDKINVSETALKPKFKQDANVEYDGDEPKPADELILEFRFRDSVPTENVAATVFERKKIMRQPSLNQVFYGPPGTGKTYRTSREAVRICDGEVSEDRDEYMTRYNELLNEGRVEFVTFHQSFSYEDFVEGLRPDVSPSSETESSGGFKLRVRNGVFKKIARRARLQLGRVDDIEWNDEHENEEESLLGRFDSSNPNLPYVLIIDELNRANISKVLGELITLLEEDKRLGKDNELTVTLPYSNESFGVTSNLYIIGTMNTADRSIALLDTALRRRFEFHEIMPDPSLLNVVDGINLAKILTFINENIESAYDRDHQIGHSHFIKCKSREDIEYAFRRHVIPLLNEYFYNRGEEVARVLGDIDKVDQIANGTGNFMTRTAIGNKGKFRWSIRSEEEGLDFSGFEQ